MKILSSDKFRFYGLCVILLAGLIFVYSNHFNNPFHFDDEHTIVNNSWIRSLKNIPHFYADGTTTSSLPQNQAYRPGLTTLNTIDYAISKWNPLGLKNNYTIDDAGLNSFYYHLSIFICFILQAILIFLLVKKILDISFNHKWDKYFALFIVALYCYHTALAETINYVISRSDSFSTFMLMLAFVIYVYFPNKRKYRLYLLPYIFGFFVKEPTLMFGPILFFYIALFEKHTDFSRMLNKANLQKIWESFKAVIHIILIGAGLYLFEYFMTPKTWSGGIISRWDYLITQPFVMVQYFKTFILPTELSADTDWAPLATMFDLRLIMGLMFITGMIWFAFRLSKYEVFRPVTFGIFWFFLALVPSSSFIPLSEVLNDHRVFFPFIGLALSVYALLIYLIILKDEKKYLSSPFRKVIVVVLLVGILCGHAYGTHYHRNKVWSSYESLWLDVTKKSPKNGRGMMNYALSQMRIGNYVKAKEYFEKARALTPGYSLVYINLGVLHTSLNDLIGAEQYFKKAIELGTYIDQSYFYYGNFLFKQKRYDEARQMLRNCISVNPAYTDARFTLMELYSETQDWGSLEQLAEETLHFLPNNAKCLAYIDAGKNKKTKLDIAIETAEKDPTADNYLNLSLYYYDVGMYNECIDACKKAINIKPDYALAYNNMCSAYNQLKMYNKAVEACNKALSIKPDFELAKNNLNLAKSQIK